MDNTQEYTCLSLCSGYGGLEFGLKRIFGKNIRVGFYVEVEAFAVANLVAKMEAGLLDAAPIWTDIKTFNAEPFRDRVHIIIAGYPCQPFSVAGQRQGTEDPRHLWPYIERIVQAVRPIWCFFENVAGHLTLGFPSVYRSLRDLGYKVEAGLFTAAECGAPHRRQRLFILAYARSTESRGLSNCQRQENSEIGPASKLANARHLPGCPEQKQQQKEWTKEHNGRCKLADTDRSRSTKDKQSTKLRASGIKQSPSNSRKPTKAEKPQGFQGSSQRWPARPGQPQYEWEEPRTIMGRLNPDWVCSLQGIPAYWTDLYLTPPETAVYNVVLEEKHYETVKEILSVLSEEVGAEAIQRKVGRFWYFFAQEILQSDLLCKRDTKRRGRKISVIKKSKQVSEKEVRQLPNYDKSSNTSQGLQYREQLKKELNDFMCNLPRKMALAKWQKGIEKIKANLFSMWENMPYSPWDVCNSLSTCKEVWESAPDEEIGRWVLGSCKRYIYWQESQQRSPNRVDQLRLLGNGCIPQCAEKAFRMLMKIFEANR